MFDLKLELREESRRYISIRVLIRSISQQALRGTFVRSCFCGCNFYLLVDANHTLLPSSMTVTISVSHKGKTHAVRVDLTNTVSSFQAQLKELTSVPIGNQKLLFKGKNASAKGDDSLEVFGLKDRIKVQMLGSTTEEVGSLRAVEDEKKRMEQILRNRETQTRVHPVTLMCILNNIIDHGIRTDIFPFDSNESFSFEHKLSFPRRSTSSPSPKPRRGPFVAHETGER